MQRSIRLQQKRSHNKTTSLQVWLRRRDTRPYSSHFVLCLVKPLFATTVPHFDCHGLESKIYIGIVGPVNQIYGRNNKEQHSFIYFQETLSLY